MGTRFTLYDPAVVPGMPAGKGPQGWSSFIEYVNTQVPC
jgi:hypothetical protein